MKNQKDTHHASRLIKWLSKNPAVQSRICGELDVSPQECIKLIDVLKDNGFYEMAYILLMGNQQDIAIGYAADTLLAELLAKEWGRLGGKKICKKLQEHIEDGIKYAEINPEVIISPSKSRLYN